MQFIAQAMVFLLQTALGASGVDLALTAAGSAPQGATLLGGTTVVQTGVVVLAISRGTGPSKHTYWTAYWSGAGS